MTALRRKIQEQRFTMRITPVFKRKIEEAAAKAGFPTASEFVRHAIIKEAGAVGVRIGRLD
jgi:uncharacterized protein (DUF1778 family)